jgi:hypothetical protein
MVYRQLLYCSVAAVSVAVFAAAPPSGSGAAAAPAQIKSANVPRLTATQIVERNVAARGGLEAWRRVRSLRMTGKMDVGRLRAPPQTSMPKEQMRQRLLEEAHDPERKMIELPFVMEVARPRKVRLELQVGGNTAVQVYDGEHGWKLRPYLNRKDAEDFTVEELKAASQQQELDGALIDYAAKGNRVDLAGIEDVEGRGAYKLTVTYKTGDVHHIWIDAQTFLEAKSDGVPRHLDGKPRAVETYYRDFRSVNGVMVPYVLETKVERVPDSEKITIEHVDVNPSLNQARFAKPS